MKPVNSICAAILFALATSALPVHAHISTKGALQSRGGDQKLSPCDGNRGDGPQYTFAPGATITVAVNENVAHPSYFRLSFDNDGQDFVEPASIDPIDKTRACPFNKDDQCGKSDYCTTAGSSKGAIVLWDNLDPHMASAAMGGSWTVKLPDVECENCTLQILQVMEDEAFHGAYCPQGSCEASGNSLEDIYHLCIDFKLVKGAPSGPGVSMDPVKNKGMECASSSPAGGAAGSTGETAGAGGTTSAAAGHSAAGAGGTAAAVGGAPAAATGGVGGGTSAITPVAGSKATTTATTAAPVAGASTPAAATTPTTSTGAAGSKSTGTTTGAATGTPVAGTPATAEASAPPASSSGGCSVAGQSRNDGAALGLLLSLGMLFVRRRR